MIRPVVLSLLPLVLAGVCGARPNFTGEWVFNAAKSDYGRMPAPEKMVRSIKHNDPKISITTKQSGQKGEITTSYTYTTDGKESINKTNFGEVKVVAKWEGDVLVVESSRQIQGAEVKQTDRWNLSEDGKTMSVITALKGPQGETRIIVTLDKQP